MPHGTISRASFSGRFVGKTPVERVFGYSLSAPVIFSGNGMIDESGQNFGNSLVRWEAEPVLERWAKGRFPVVVLFDEDQTAYRNLQDAAMLASCALEDALRNSSDRGALSHALEVAKRVDRSCLAIRGSFEVAEPSIATLILQTGLLRNHAHLMRLISTAAAAISDRPLTR